MAIKIVTMISKTYKSHKSRQIYDSIKNLAKKGVYFYLPLNGTITNIETNKTIFMRTFRTLTDLIPEKTVSQLRIICIKFLDAVLEANEETSIKGRYRLDNALRLFAANGQKIGAILDDESVLIRRD